MRMCNLGEYECVTHTEVILVAESVPAAREIADRLMWSTFADSLDGHRGLWSAQRKRPLVELFRAITSPEARRYVLPQATTRVDTPWS